MISKSKKISFRMIAQDRKSIVDKTVIIQVAMKIRIALRQCLKSAQGINIRKVLIGRSDESALTPAR